MADDIVDDWWDNNSKINLSGKNKKKRKRDEDHDEDSPIQNNGIGSKKKIKIKRDSSPAVETVPLENASRAKKHKKKKPKAFEGNVVSTPDSFIKMVDSHYSESLSAIEKSLVELKAGHFGACNDGSHTITSFIKTLFPKWKKALKSNEGLPQKPIILIMCSSALRCVELIKQMSDLRSDKCIIAKLFAKHMKLEETQAFLKSKTIHIAVGTPNRLHSLIASGDLLMSCVKHVILDVSHKDVKKCTLFDIKIVKSDLMKLMIDFVIPHVKNDLGRIDLF